MAPIHATHRPPRPGIGGKVAGLLFGALLIAGPAAAQGIPRTSSGHPDLQGNWTNETLTPLERPAGVPLVLSPADVERLEEQRLSSLSNAVHSGLGTYDPVYYQHGEGFAVVNGEVRSSLITFPEDGRVPDLADDARRRVAAARAERDRFGRFDNPENLSLADRCLLSFGSNAGPPMLPNGFYNNNYTIVQTPGHVMIFTEMVHDARIIRLGEPRPLPPHVRPWFGDSWGRWEADTLVVETTNFHPLQQLRGIPSDELRVIERFHLVDDGGTLLYRFRVEDPSSYVEPWGGEVPMVPLDGLLYEYACHEGNYALPAMLRGR